MADAHISPAHAAVVDAALFLTAQVMADDRTDMIWAALDDALPLAAKTSGNARIDSIVAATATLAAAQKSIKAKAPDAGRAFFTAHWALRDALTEYAWFRFARSYDALKA